MNISESLRTFIGVVSSQPLLARLFFASLEFAVLCLVVAVALRLWRTKSPRLASVLWLLVLAKPVATLAIGTSLPIVEFEALPVAGVVLPEPVSVVQMSRGFLPRDNEPQKLHRIGSQFGRPGSPAFDRGDQTVGVASDLPAGDAAVMAAAEGAADVPAATPDHPLPGIMSGFLISMLWMAGSAIVLLLGVIDRWRLRRLVAKAHEPGAALSSRYASIASNYKSRRRPRLFETDDLESPALIGTIVPVILIPAWLARDPNPAKVDWALRHELMHWRLCDPIAGLVRQLAQVLFYFHPVAWWAGRKWEEATELACDRAIVTSFEDSRDYAEQLYGMLVQIRDRRRMPVSSGLFATRTQIGRRIAALLNGAHATPARLSALAVACVLVLSAVTLSIGGAFADKPNRPIETGVVTAQSSTDQPPVVDPVASTANPGATGLPSGSAACTTSNPAAANPKANAAVAIRGQVLDPEGKPLAGAKVWALSYIRSGVYIIDTISKVDETTTNRVGEFELTLPNEPQQIPARSEHFVSRSYVVIASADGYALDWAKTKRQPSNSLSLQLTKAPLPIEGRVLNLEGGPVAGVRIRVLEVATAKSSLDEWIERVRAFRPTKNGGRVADLMGQREDRQVRTFPVNKLLETGPSQPISEAVTGMDGRFRLQGLGADRQVRLLLEGDTIVKTLVCVVTRPMAPLPNAGRENPRFAGLCYGSTFDFAAQPTQIVTGVVRDADSGHPLPGVKVVVHTFPGSDQSVDGFLSVTSDREGRYRLVGIPKSTGGARPTKLRVLPSESQAYFRSIIEVPGSVNLEPVTCDVVLTRTAVVHGRITDKATGQPVPSQVLYVPFIENPHARNHPNFNGRSTGFRHDERYHTADDGTYRIPAIPGRGVVLAIGLEKDRYRLGVGADEIGWTAPKSPPGPKVVYEFPSPELTNAVRPVEIDGREADPVCDIELVPLTEQTIVLKDPEGKPISEVIGVGSNSRGGGYGRYPLATPRGEADGKFVLYGLDAGQKRLALLLQKERRLGAAVVVEGGKTTEIRLQPCATISGRVVDTQGRPITGSYLLVKIPVTELPGSGNATDGRRPLRNLVAGYRRYETRRPISN